MNWMWCTQCWRLGAQWKMIKERWGGDDHTIQMVRAHMAGSWSLKSTGEASREVGSVYLLTWLGLPGCLIFVFQGFPGGASGKEPACQCRRQETWVQSLGWEDPLGKGMATHSIPWTEERGGLWGCKRVRHDWSDMAYLAELFALCCCCFAWGLFWQLKKIKRSLGSFEGEQPAWS